MTDITDDINTIAPNAIAGSATVDLSSAAGIGVLGGSQAAEAVAGSMGTIGVAAIADQNSTVAGGATAYGEYVQTNKEVGSTGDAQGIEISVVNANSTAPQVGPSNQDPANLSEGLRIGAGRPDETSGPVSVAEQIVNVSGESSVGFEAGIVEGSNAILPDSQNIEPALVLAPGQSIVWRNSAGQDVFYIRSDKTSLPINGLIVASDGSLNLQNAAGQNIWSVIPSGTDGSIQQDDNRTHTVVNS